MEGPGDKKTNITKTLANEIYTLHYFLQSYCSSSSSAHIKLTQLTILRCRNLVRQRNKNSTSIKANIWTN